ncbi:DNA helicase, partial [Tanacetum coccineum]
MQYRPIVIGFPNIAQEHIPGNHQSAECSRGHTQYVDTEAAFAINKPTTTDGRKRRDACPLLTARAEEPSSSRNIKRRFTLNSSRTQHATENKNYQNVNNQKLRSMSSQTKVSGDKPSYRDLGSCDQVCRHCGCIFWYNERLKGAQYTREAEYHLCCGRGKIYMHSMPNPHTFIQQLLSNTHFMKHIQAYNQIFAMTSIGAKIDDSVNKGMRPYVFKISGQIYHWIGSLCLEEDHHPRFLQLYVYDTCDEVSSRIRHFGVLDESTLNPEIVEGFYPDLTLKPQSGKGKGKKVMMNAYYKYQLHPRVKKFSLIFRSGRSFQQYVVKVFCVIDMNRLDFIRNNQNDFRSDYLSGLYDAVSMGYREGIAAGSKIMLPNTFTGGPRYMAQYPELTPTDRAYIVCRVFEQKVKYPMNFLKDVRTFGHVCAVIMKYLVNISKKARILELKRRYFEEYYSENQYAVSIKEDTAYSCLHSPNTTKETSSIS